MYVYLVQSIPEANAEIELIVEQERKGREALICRQTSPEDQGGEDF